TSNNKQLDDIIKKSQLQTNSPNHAYLEWIPYDYIRDDWRFEGGGYLYGLPTYRHASVELIPLETTDETHDLYYVEVNYLLMRHVYLITIGLLLCIIFTSYVISILIFLTRMFG